MTTMKYDHTKILAESASLTLSDLKQLQEAPGPITEKRRGKLGTPKGEEHARDTEERTEIRQKHEDEVASSDGGPYVARDIKVGSYQPSIRGSGGSRQPKKKPGYKGNERRLSRLARHRRSLKKK